MKSIVVTLSILAFAASAHAGEKRKSQIPKGAKVCVDADADVESALQAAILKKKVPVVLVAECAEADFTLRVPRVAASQEKTATRIAKLALFGGFAGCGKNVNMDATVVNAEGVLIFGKTSSKCDLRKASEDVAKALKKYIEKGKL